MVTKNTFFNEKNERNIKKQNKNIVKWTLIFLKALDLKFCKQFLHKIDKI